jgi:hypothetical protein
VGWKAALGGWQAQARDGDHGNRARSGAMTESVGRRVRKAPRASLVCRTRGRSVGPDWIDSPLASQTPTNLKVLNFTAQHPSEPSYTCRGSTLASHPTIPYIRYLMFRRRGEARVTVTLCLVCWWLTGDRPAVDWGPVWHKPAFPDLPLQSASADGQSFDCGTPDPRHPRTPPRTPGRATVVHPRRYGRLMESQLPRAVLKASASTYGGSEGRNLYVCVVERIPGPS